MNKAALKHSTEPEYDICIVGAGVVGLTAAAILSRSDLSIAVVEKQIAGFNNKKPPTANDNYDLRVSAINLASMQIFEHLGIAQSMLDQRASAYECMQVWDANSDARIEFDAAEIDQNQLGYILENSLMVNTLLSFLNSKSNVVFLAGNAPNELNQAPDHIRLNLDQITLSAKLVIGADGQYSAIRALGQFKTELGSFEQSALVCRIQTEHKHQATAYQCFHESGPIAYLPLADGSSSIVWSCDTERAETLKQLDDKAFAKEVETAMQNTLGQVEILSKRGAFALTQQHATRYISQRLALIGDAAHRTHPLAGLGANIGLQDAAVLAETILKAHSAHRQYYSDATLRQYERRRKHQNSIILQAMQAFKSGFASRSPTVSALRAFALNRADRIAPVKSIISRLATGTGGDLAELSQL